MLNNNDVDQESKKKKNSSDLILPSGRHCKVASQRCQISLNDVLVEVFEKGDFEMILKKHGATEETQKEARAKFSEEVMARYLKKTENIHKKAFESCILEITQEDNRNQQEERRKDWLARVIIHYYKRGLVKGKGLEYTQVEKEIVISYPVIIGLVVIVHVAANKIDKDKLENLCNAHSYFVADERCFRWGRRDGEDSGIFGDTAIEELVAEIIPKITKNVLNLGKPKIIEIISMSDIWIHNEEVGNRNFKDEEVEELISLLEKRKL